MKLSISLITINLRVTYILTACAKYISGCYNIDDDEVSLRSTKQ